MSNIYDPFDLDPPKSVIKSAVNEFKIEARKLLDEVASLRQNPLADWLIAEKLAMHQQLITKIRRYQMYLDGVDISKDWESAKLRAKERKITEFYAGKLRRSGNGRMMGKCPFHKAGQENTPSFIIYANNTAHCFSCNWNGDVIDFIQKQQNLDFKAAVKLLSQ